MSASSKKKLRKEAAAAQLTEKQQKAQAEEKKLKATTVSFVAIMLIVVLAAASILGIRAVNNSGIIDKNTIAAVVNGHELNSVQVNYYFSDYVQSQYSTWQSSYGSSTSIYLQMMGLDLSKPLNEQSYSSSTNQTWADFFLEQALAKAKSDYALYDKAMADESFTLPEDQQVNQADIESYMGLYASVYGYSNANKYLQAMYGFGSDVESYTQYQQVIATAQAYYNAHQDSLSYDDAAIRAYEADKYDNYSSFSYAAYYVNATDYRTGGTKDESGNTTYTDEEIAAGVTAAEETANKLAESADLIALDKAIAALEINAENESAAATQNTDVLYTSIPAVLQSWLTDDARTENEIGVVPYETTSTDSEGNETKTTSGFYVIVYQGRNDNLTKVANVRHLLIAFTGGTSDSNGNMTYSDEKKAEAKAEAEKLLEEWKAGEATEESFIALIEEHSDDTVTEEGLIEHINPGTTDWPEAIRNWATNPDHKVGDTQVLIGDSGYHVVYFVGEDELTYRDYMISEELLAEEMEEWYNAIVDAATLTTGKTNRINMDLVVSAS